MFKFSGFSPRANAAINSALSEASILGHSFVGTEHLLWGILREGDAGELKSISASKTDCERVMGKLLENIGRGTKSNLSPADFSPLCRKILENSLAEAKRCGGFADIATIFSCMLRMIVLVLHSTLKKPQPHPTKLKRHIQSQTYQKDMKKLFMMYFQTKLVFGGLTQMING